jgi:hypothetical protein
MNKRLLTLVILTASVVSFAATHTSASPATPVVGNSYVQIPRESRVTSVTVDQTFQVQYVLKSYGYSIAVDGVYGPQTTDRVKRWQRSNGLVVDGIAGPVTRRSLGLDGVVQHPDTPKTAPAPPSAPSGSVEDMIRAIWPDDLENEALRIAWRESTYRPGVTSPTGCCHGVFQIHEVHFSWMRAFGVTTVEQLFDAETNIRMAYELYKRNGWGPWRL